MSEGAEALLRAIREQDPDFDFLGHRFVPWAPLEAAPLQAKVALVGTAGVYLKKGWHAPFEPGAPGGAPTWREMPANADPEDLAIAHGQYDQAAAMADINAVFPLQRLHELAEAGYLGSVAPVAYSFSGHLTRPLPLLAEHAPNVAWRLKRAGADLALIVAASGLCHQTAALIARTVELAGVPTLCLGVREAEALLELAGAPRSVVVDHPFGAVLGAPGNAAKHQHLLREAMEAAWEMGLPGSIHTLTRYRWRPS